MGNIPFIYVHAVILCLIIVIMFSNLIKNMIVAQLRSTLDTFPFLSSIDYLAGNAQPGTEIFNLPAVTSSSK